MSAESWAAERARRALTFALAHRRDRLRVEVHAMTVPELRAVVMASDELRATARNELAGRQRR